MEVSVPQPVAILQLSERKHTWRNTCKKVPCQADHEMGGINNYEEIKNKGVAYLYVCHEKGIGKI